MNQDIFANRKKLIENASKFCFDRKEILNLLMEKLTFNEFQSNLNQIICRTINCEASFFMFFDPHKRKLKVNVLNNKILSNELTFPICCNSFFERILMTGISSSILNEEYQQQFSNLLQTDVRSILYCCIFLKDNILMPDTRVIACLVNKRYTFPRALIVTLSQRYMDEFLSAKQEFSSTDEKNVNRLFDLIYGRFVLHSIQFEENDVYERYSKLINLFNDEYQNCNTALRVGIHIKIRKLFEAENAKFIKMRDIYKKKKNKIPVLLNLQNLYADHGKEFVLQISKKQYTIRNFMCAPIKHKDQFLGIYLLSNKLNEDYFTEDDKKVFRHFASMFVVFLRNLEDKTTTIKKLNKNYKQRLKYTLNKFNK